MTSAGISRRGFIGGTAGAGLVLVIGAKASAQASGDGPYGALAAQPDANGLLLPEGFSSRVIARAGETVAGTRTVARLPGRGRHLPDRRRRLVLRRQQRDPDAGRRRRQRHRVRRRRRGRRRLPHPRRHRRRTAPAGRRPGAPGCPARRPTAARSGSATRARRRQRRRAPALGRFQHEAAAVDPDDERRLPDRGRARRLPSTASRPDAYPDLTRRHCSRWRSVGRRRRGDVARGAGPGGGRRRRRATQVARGRRAFDGGEGCWYADGVVYFTTKGDNHVRASTRRPRPMDGHLRRRRPVLLTGVDNITVEAGSGDLYVAEDGGDMQLVVITADGDVAPVAAGRGRAAARTGRPRSPARLLTRRHPPLLQLAAGRRTPRRGITYEITGPFRGIDQEPAPTTTRRRRQHHRGRRRLGCSRRRRRRAARLRCPSASPSVPPPWSWVAWSPSAGAGSPTRADARSGSVVEGNSSLSSVPNGGLPRAAVGAPVDEQDGAAVAGGPDVGQLQAVRAGVVEQALSRAEHDRVHAPGGPRRRGRPPAGPGRPRCSRSR